MPIPKSSSISIFSDRLVDEIEEGLDAVVRTGQPADSRLMCRSAGSFRLRIVASSDYLASYGITVEPVDLAAHRCLRERSPSTGKQRPWRLGGQGSVLPETVSATAVRPLVHLAAPSHGIACPPPFAIRRELADGRLVSSRKEHIREEDQFDVLWPASRQVTHKFQSRCRFHGNESETGYLK